MAFKDMTVILYDGSIRLDYKDASHYYGVRERKDFEADANAPVNTAEFKRAWGPNRRPKGTTTLLGDTLEKKGLFTWPMGMALQELFGFYDFDTTDKDGETIRKTGFSKDKGTLYGDDGALRPLDPEELLPVVLSASKNYTRKQKKGADIGSVVHDAIEHFILANPNKPEHKTVEVEAFELDDDGNKITDLNGTDGWKTFMAKEFAKDEYGEYIFELPPIQPSNFDIQEQYMWKIKESEYDTEADRDKALEDFAADTAMASIAFDRFVVWWADFRPELLAAEQLVYSKKNHVSGTFDALIRIDGKVYLVDWKTSNASQSRDAAMPEGINYQYFIQDAIYAIGLEEEGSLLEGLGVDKIDGLMVVSCRKDGGFTAIESNEVGLTKDDCVTWANAVMLSHKFATTVKAGLWAHAEGVK